MPDSRGSVCVPSNLKMLQYRFSSTGSRVNAERCIFRSGKPSLILNMETVPRKSCLLSGPTSGPNQTNSSLISSVLAGAWKPSFLTHSSARAA